MKVLVCDDVPERRDEIVQKIVDSGQPKPEVVTEQQLTDELTKLFKRARQCMNDPATYTEEDVSCFHDVDLVILDNNLTHLPGEGPPLTAESIAGYIRAFTNAAYIVSLNVNPDVDFDLRYLVGDFSSRADLALNTDHVANPALWSGDVSKSTGGFLPWYWPQLERAADHRRTQIEFVKGRLNDAVTKAFGFDTERIEHLSFHARGALSPVASSDGEGGGHFVPIDKLKFRHVFLAKDRSLPIKEDRVKLNKAEEAGHADVRELIARVVAADIDLWFRRDVVGPQEPLLDVPHLLMRFPFLLGEKAQNVEEWNKAIQVTKEPFGLDGQLYEQHLAKARFEHEAWIKTPCFWWPTLKADEKLNQYFLTVKEGAWPNAVFCEDRSQFAALSEDKGAPVEFSAEFEGSWARRFVARLEGVRYAPLSRLAV
jgi:hypothetical protein